MATMPTLDFNDPMTLYDTDRARFRGIDRTGAEPREVWCAVSDVALQDFGEVAGNQREDWEAVYAAKAPAIQAAASRKYFNGGIEADGSVLVTTADLNG